jgi:hypothetical protein
MTKKSEPSHALLSASSAKKWLHCTPSARLEADIPEEPSEYAAEGTLAHSIGELKLRKQFIDKNMTEAVYKKKMNALKKVKEYQAEMDGYTDEYVDYVTSIAYGFPTAPTVAVEKRLDYSPWAPEGFGTGDCLILHGTDLHVIDFKYGKGVPVSAQNNPQMMLYALGAYSELAFIYGIKTAHLHIVQPRIPNNSHWEIAIDDLLKWGEMVVKPAAEKAFKGEGDFRPAGDGDAENYCKTGFCKAYGRCRATTQKNMALMEDAWKDGTGPVLPPLISWEEAGALLKKAQFLADWVKKLEAATLSEIVRGGSVPGWKIIEGRSNRELIEFDALANKLQAIGYAEAVLYEKKPIGLTAMEKLLTKEDKNGILKEYIVKPQGKATLVPEDDKRPAMQLKTTAAEAFGGANAYKEG